jgi:hypothetical protein
MKYLPLTLAALVITALSMYAFQLRSELARVGEAALQYQAEAARNGEIAKLYELRAMNAEAELRRQMEIVRTSLKK